MRGKFAITANDASMFRSLLLFLLALILNLGIFILIQQLVSQSPVGIRQDDRFNKIDFTYIKPTPKLPAKKQKKKPLKPPQKEPPPVLAKVEPIQPDMISTKGPELDIKLPPMAHSLPLLGSILAQAKPATPQPKQQIYTNVKPSIKVEPIYPMRALRRGIEGEVTVEFTITSEGAVRDPKIIAADPPRIFNSAVLNAVKKWRFEPNKDTDTPAERRARQRIKFSLKD